MKKIRFMVMALCVALGVHAFAERAPEYISPNNDGVQDTLVIPLKIKEKRYIREWKLTIYNMDGKVIRTIGNKQKGEEKLTFLSFIKKMFKLDKGVEVPSTVVWNGLLGDEAAKIGLVPGEVAPDGKYYYIFRATDDNYNTGASAKYYVIVDCTPPVITLESIPDAEKSFGEGSKPSVKIKQNGSEEVLWSGAIIYAADGTKIKTFRWENSSPAPEVIWDGTGDDGVVVKDGVYYYEIYATDLAGNKSEKAVINNIIFSAEKPVTDISLKGGKSFSPNGDGIKDTMPFNVELPVAPSAVNTLTDWTISIVDSTGKVRMEKKGGSEGIKEYVFDGKTSDGTNLSDGIYKAILTAKYKNGYMPEAKESPEFILDVTSPEASVSISDKIFNGSKKLRITQRQTSPVPNFNDGTTWIGTIKNSDGKIVKTFDFGSKLVDAVEWSGAGDNGLFVADGSYVYELKGEDFAGNTGIAKSEAFILDSSKTELMLNASPEIFSNEITFYPTVKAATGIASYEFVVKNEAGEAVYSVKANGDVPASIKWNGKTSAGNMAEDGKYYGQIKTLAKSGTSAYSQELEIEKDSESPEIAISPVNKTFSPDGLPVAVSPKQTMTVKVEKSSAEESWVYEFRNERNMVVRQFVQSGKNSETVRARDFEWDGKDDNGNKVPDGKYSVRVYSVDRAGNRGEDAITNIVVDTRNTVAYVTVADEMISPNGDGYKDAEVFSIKPSLNAEILSWNFKVLGSDGSAVKQWEGKVDSTVPLSIKWDGKDAEGKVCEGQFYGALDIEYKKGNLVSAQSTPFVVTATPPVLSVISSANPEEYEYFSPDNDGVEDELDMLLYAKTLVGVKSWSLVIKDSHNPTKVFWKTSGKTMPVENSKENLYCAAITWDGRGNDGDMVMSAEDYPYEFTVTDNLGMTSVYTGIVPVDVLVIFDNGRLKMQVPSIIFRGDAADFKLTGEIDDNGKVIARSSLTKAQRDNNERVLGRVAQILKKFGGYKVVVVGHANPMVGSKESELVSLSKERAEFVKRWLISEGKIAESRLSAEGKGGSETIANSSDTQVNWKNRRVEFILEK